MDCDAEKHKWISKWVYWMREATQKKCIMIPFIKKILEYEVFGDWKQPSGMLWNGRDGMDSRRWRRRDVFQRDPRKCRSAVDRFLMLIVVILPFTYAWLRLTTLYCLNICISCHCISIKLFYKYNFKAICMQKPSKFI